MPDRKVKFDHLVVPDVHQNGTHPSSLIGELVESRGLLSDAFDALKRAGPNGRDYYSHRTPGALKLATEQHDDRLRRIDELIQEIDHLVEEIDKQPYPGK